MDFGALPPEVNSGRMYTGPGAGPMLAAAGAWDSVAAELGLAAMGYNSVLTELTGGPWVGPAAQSMIAAATPYVSWLSGAAVQTEQTAAQARAAAAAYEAAFAMTVPPPLIAANRALLMALVATNFFGQNTPAIMATEAHYGEMWAQDAAAMYGYAGASASASTVTPFNAPPQTTNPAGDPISWLYQEISALTSSNRNTLRYLTVGLPYFSLGMVQSFASYAQQLIPNSAGGAGAAGSAPLPGAGLPGLSGLRGTTTPVSATVGKASTIGRLSVPASWAAGSAAANPPATSSSVTSITAAPEKSGPGGLLRGIPLTGVARQAAGGYTHRYGFRYRVMPRPPSAG